MYLDRYELAQGAIYQTTTQDVGYYAIMAAQTYLNLYFVFLHLPSSSRSDDLSQSNLLLRVFLGRPGVKTPTVGAHRGSDHCDH